MVQRVDTYMNFRFRVELDGIQQAGFMECSGLGSQVEVVEYREGE
jgi:phage tail-like protein